MESEKGQNRCGFDFLLTQLSAPGSPRIGERKFSKGGRYRYNYSISYRYLGQISAFSIPFRYRSRDRSLEHLKVVLESKNNTFPFRVSAVALSLKEVSQD